MIGGADWVNIILKRREPDTKVKQQLKDRTASLCIHPRQHSVW